MHGRPNLVAHVGQEIGFQLGRFLERCDHASFGGLSFGEVAGDLAEAGQGAGAIYGGDDDIRPKARAILLIAPPLVLHFAFAQAQLELFFRFLCFAIFLAVKH